MHKQDRWKFIEDRLESRAEQHRLRSLISLTPDPDRPAIVQKEGRDYINFCSNDYLGLAKDPRLIQRSKEYADRYGAGSTASRLISGTYEIHQKLEEKIADIFDREAALLFNSGFQANSTLLGTILDRRSLLITDKLIHNSLIQGGLLGRADYQRFDHNDYDQLEELLKKAESRSYRRIMIATESVYSMDGDRCDIDRLVSLSNQYDTLLFIDDAHAVGVLGDRGRGLTYGRDEVDLMLGTCGKALGSFGAFVCCSKKMRDFLVNYCPGFIYTTALPPPVIGAIDAAMDAMPEMTEERERLRKHTEYLRLEIQSLGFDTGNSSSQILPVIVGDEQEAMDLAEELEEAGILARAIRPPTVPPESSRIRITVTSSHEQEHIARFLKVLEQWNGK